MRICSKTDVRNSMRYLEYTLFMLIGMCAMISCNSEETYAEQKEREKNTIESFIKRDFVIRAQDGTVVLNVGRINVISEQQFESQGNVTDVSLNQYVKMNSSGMYMQIVNEGCGEKLQSGESARLACRFLEYNIMGDSIQTTNWFSRYVTNPEIIDVSNTSGTFSATFATDVYWGSMFNEVYGSTSVPEGWILAMRYLKLGNSQKENGERAHVRIIVPHSLGQANALQNVYPCFYDLTFEELYQ